ncbi:MAG: hypothetical protein A2017_08905 [Lentisphaerae bacterium GWF2_44_16]|nr:MAG: hypothetical protein A2017_08905 [Lentisphaerae bacterium GWF2_44_16]
MLKTEEKNNVAWEMNRASAESPWMLCCLSGGLKKYTEDPVCPEKEAIEVMIERLPSISMIVMPPSSPATLNALLRKAPELKKIFVADRNAKRLNAWKQSYGDIKNKESVEVLALSDDDAALSENIIKEKLNAYTVELFLGKSAVYIPGRFRRIDPEFSSFLEKNVLRVQQEACTVAAFRTTRSWHITMNQLFNLEFKSSLKADLTEENRKQTVVIVGAGPSLDLNVNVLKKYSDKAIIIATDASLKTLLDNGITPDFAATLEDLHLSWRFFSKSLEKKIPLFISIGANHVLARKYTGPAMLVGTANAPVWLRDLSGGLPEVTTGQCVGHFVFHLAELFEPSEIVMTGFDLSFRDGKFHAANMATPYLKDRPESFTVVEVDGINGTKVKTDISMSFYIKYFENVIKKCSCPVVNATEGGALIRGTRVSSLEDALKDKASKKRIGLSRNVAFNSSEKNSRLSEIAEEIDRMLPEFKNFLDKSAGMSEDNVKNPLSGFSLSSPTFTLLSSCCNVLLISRFSDIAGNYSREKFKEFRDLLQELLIELIDASNFIKTVLELRNFKAPAQTKLLVLKPENMDISKFSGLFQPASSLVIYAETALPDIWRNIIDNKVTKVISFDGNIIPDVWSVPDISVVDIKTTFVPQFYERSLWIPSYSLACYDENVLEQWKKYVPDDINCYILGDEILWKIPAKN